MRLERSIPRITPTPGLDRALARVGDAVAPKQSGQFPAQIRTATVLSQNDARVQVNLDNTPTPATALGGEQHPVGSTVLCLTTPDRVVVLGRAMGFGGSTDGMLLAGGSDVSIDPDSGILIIKDGSGSINIDGNEAQSFAPDGSPGGFTLNPFGGSINTGGDINVGGDADVDGVVRSVGGWEPVIDAVTGDPVINDSRLVGLTGIPTNQAYNFVSGPYRMIRIYITGETAEPTAGTLLGLRINGNNGAGMYQWVKSVTDTSGVAWTANNSNASYWQVGIVRNGFRCASYEITLTEMAGATSFKSGNAIGGCVVGSLLVQSHMRTTGLADTGTVTSINLLLQGGPTWGTGVTVTIEGFRTS